MKWYERTEYNPHGSHPSAEQLDVALGWVICFADGCVSWIGSVSRVGALKRLAYDEWSTRHVAARLHERGGVWDGCFVLEVTRPDLPGGPVFDVDIDVELPSYRECPRHRDRVTDEERAAWKDDTA